MLSPLTARQEECLRLTTFRTDKEIAAELGLSEATVKKHVHAAYQRLGVNRRKAALALLGPKVPAATKGPIGNFPDPASDTVTSTDIDHGPDDTPPAPLDMERSGNGPRSVRPDLSARAATPAPAGRFAHGRLLGDAAGPAGTGVEHGLGPGPGRRLGYRPPPESRALRLLIIGLIVVVGAVMLVGVFEMAVRFQSRVGEIDRIVTANSHGSEPTGP
jgi:DNA-binding CsgD family transcriptional regulator